MLQSSTSGADTRSAKATEWLTFSRYALAVSGFTAASSEKLSAGWMLAGSYE